MKKDLVSTYMPKVYKTILWIAVVVCVAIAGNAIGHAGEVFYATEVGPGQVDDHTTSYYFLGERNYIRSFSDFKLIESS